MILSYELLLATFRKFYEPSDNYQQHEIKRSDLE